MRLDAAPSARMRVAASNTCQSLAARLLIIYLSSAYPVYNEHLAYYVGGDNAIHFWYWDGSSWADQTLGGNVLPGTSPSSYFRVVA